VAQALDALPEPKQHPAFALTGLVVPHGDLTRAAGVMAAGYKVLRDLPLERVILLVPAHGRRRPPVAVLDAERWTVPTGTLALDREAAVRLAAEHPFVQVDRGAFLAEPLAEVHLPMLVAVAPRARLLPLLLAAPAEEEVRRLARTLLKTYAFDASTVLVASTDLRLAPELASDDARDAAALELLTAEDPDVLPTAVREGRAPLCGVAPVRLLLEVARALQAAPPAPLARAPGMVALSVLTPVDRHEGVAPATPEVDKALGWPEPKRRDLVEVASKTVLGHVVFDKAPDFPISKGPLSEKHGAVVTLRLEGRIYGEGSHLEPDLPLWQAVREAAGAALARPRAGQPELTRESVTRLGVEVTVLTPPEPLDQPLNVRVGRDGLQVERGEARALLLPQLAMELSWTPLTFVRQACRRAGLPVECRWLPGVTWRRFGVLVQR